MIVEIVEREIDPDSGIEDELHSQPLDQFDLTPQNRLGQSVLGKRKTQHPSRFGLAVIDGDVVSEHREIERGRKSGWPCTNHWQSCVPSVRA